MPGLESSRPGNQPLKLTTSPKALTITAPDFTVVVNRQNAAIESLRISNAALRRKLTAIETRTIENGHISITAGFKLPSGELKRRLGIGAGQTTSDKEFTLEEVACLGACALAPVMTIDSEYHGSMTMDKVKKTLDQYK
jgi:hypothetical protein